MSALPPTLVEVATKLAEEIMCRNRSPFEQAMLATSTAATVPITPPQYPNSKRKAESIDDVWGRSDRPRRFPPPALVEVATKLAEEIMCRNRNPFEQAMQATSTTAVESEDEPK